MAPSVEDIILDRLERLDEKMDDMLQRVTRVEENTKSLPARVTALEDIKGYATGVVAVIAAAISAFVTWVIKRYA
jgi:tetrahydromethanopterin S-methyltransferase subunit B